MKTSRRGSGISSTWRVAGPTTGAPARLAPHSVQVSGVCTTMRSGSLLGSVEPGAPFCLLGFRASAPSASGPPGAPWLGATAGSAVGAVPRWRQR
jgi:hypothetical protein